MSYASAASRTILVEPPDRLLDRLAGRAAIEVVEVQVVAVDVRDARLEAVADARVDVLADRDEEVRADVVAGDAAAEVGDEAPPGRVVLVVLEELLELVEHHEERRVERARRRGHGVVEVLAGELEPRAVGRKGSLASRIAAIRPVTGSSRQALKTTGTEPSPSSSRSPSARRSACRRSRAATPARNSELLPTPLCAYRSVSREARRLPMIRLRSASRPKKTSASRSPK